MTGIVLDLAIERLRAAFTPAEVRQVLPYGGEFTAEEVAHKTYTCPAIFVACLGWAPQTDSKRLRGPDVVQVHMAAFVVFKHVERTARMRGAMVLAERASHSLRTWAPNVGTRPYLVAPLDKDTPPTVENLYGRKMDALSQSLWMLRWSQDAVNNGEPPSLADLLYIEIDENPLPGQVPPAPPPGGVVPTVTDGITFSPLPPAEEP
ncbi:MAG: hypothetical protein ACLGJD_13575 [Gammaproteobacteria bacterium]|jgi:hypothetical protein